MSGRPRSIGVLGGGTAGYFAALAIKRFDPGLAVTVVESSRIPVIGVGEATTPFLPPFLHHGLGLDVHTLWAEVRPTFKLGIRFFWGRPGDYFFNYAFGDGHPHEAHVHEADVRRYSPTSLMMTADTVPVLRQPDGAVGSLLGRLKVAYHLDNKPFVAYLARQAERAGIARLDATIAEATRTEDGERVAGLIASDGRRLTFDLYVDCTGFRSTLLEQTLGSPFTSYASTLFCDTAVVASVPHGGHLKPYTLAETMSAGWCWNIPQVDEDHRGYVFASAFQSLDEAAAEMRRKNPGMGEPWTVRFRSGRHAHFAKGNVVALGNAYGFVEPLESTALHMVIVEVAYLLRALADPMGPDHALRLANDRVPAHWDYLRWFLGLHYRYNAKLDTPFWQACRATADVSGLEPMVERFRAEGPFSGRADLARDEADAVFGHRGLDIMLLGQGIEPAVRPAMPRERWDPLHADWSRLAGLAMPQAQALRELGRRPDLLDEMVAGASWCQEMGRAFPLLHGVV